MRRKITPLLLVIIAAASLSASSAASSADEVGYNSVVRLVETHYRVKHKGVPFLASAGMKTARIVSSDVRKYAHLGGFKLAVFADQEFARGRDAEFYAAMRRTLEPQWTPLVVVRGADEGQTYTYTREEKGKFKVLICVVGERDGTVLQVELNEAEFAKLLMNPERETREITDEVTRDNPDDN